MSLSFLDKKLLYEEMAQLESNGIPLGEAARMLAKASGGGTRSWLKSLGRALEKEHSAGEALQRVAGGSLDGGVLAATARSGQLDTGFRYLSEYYGMLHGLRREVISNVAYPVFLLHFAVLMLGIPAAVAGGGVQGYITAVLTALGWLYGAGVLVAAIVTIFKNLAESLSTVDAFVMAVPLVGKVRAAMARTRFLSALNVQMDAGINIIDSLKSAASASASASWASASGRMQKRIRKGETFADAIAVERVCPRALARAIGVAEMSGGLESTLRKWAAESMEEARRRIATLASWIPKLIYLGVVLFIAWRVVSVYSGILNDQILPLLQ